MFLPWKLAQISNAAHSSAHKATVLAEADNLDINSDGTTLNQKKVQGMLANGLVLGVEAVTNGSAQSSVEAFDRVLERIREVGTPLGMRGAENIDWTLIRSSMSDSASTQQAFNRLVQERMNETHQQSSQTTPQESRELLEVFCGMHLGVNLRTAEVHGLEEYRGNQDNNDTLLH